MTDGRFVNQFHEQVEGFDLVLFENINKLFGDSYNFFYLCADLQNFLPDFLNGFCPDL